MLKKLAHELTRINTNPAARGTYYCLIVHVMAITLINTNLNPVGADLCVRPIHILR